MPAMKYGDSFCVDGFIDGLPATLYPTGTVQMVPGPITIQEPSGVYELSNGRLVLSHQCKPWEFTDV